MLLVVDAGNTNIVFAVREGNQWRGTWRTRTASDRTSDEYAVWLLTLLQPRRPEARRHLRRRHRHGGARRAVPPAPPLPRLVPCRAACRPFHPRLGLRNPRGPPAEVGADRLLNALAGHQRFGGPLIIIDFGTATTFDVVDKDGAYVGGVICPGINLSIESLHQAAAQLPRIGIARPQAVIGRSTVPAMQSGVYWGYVGMIEGLVARIKAEFGAPMRVIATGGLAPLFSEGTLVIEQIEPDLTLDGLRLLAERNPAPTLPRERTRLIETE